MVRTWAAIYPEEIPDPLQWSHVFSDMVRLHVRERDCGAGRASMEPCLFRHGKEQTPPGR